MASALNLPEALAGMSRAHDFFQCEVNFEFKMNAPSFTVSYARKPIGIASNYQRQSAKPS